MEFDAGGMLYAAAEDRILRISGDGAIIPIVEKKFTGNWGACGIALDKEGTVFYAYDNKIMKITAGGSGELFLDGSRTSPPLEAIVGIDFAPDYRNLFVCDGKLEAGKLARIPMNTDGGAGSIELLYHDPKVNTEYMAFDKDSNIIVKGPWSASFIRVKTNGQVESLKHDTIGFGIQTIAWGGRGFDPNALFGTHMPSGIVYKILLP